MYCYILFGRTFVPTKCEKMQMWFHFHLSVTKTSVKTTREALHLWAARRSAADTTATSRCQNRPYFKEWAV